MRENSEKEAINILKKQLNDDRPEALDFIKNSYAAIHSAIKTICFSESKKTSEQYHQNQNFCVFIREHVRDNDFARIIHDLVSKILQKRLQNEPLTIIDKELIVHSEHKKQTISFLIANVNTTEFNEFYSIFSEDISSGKKEIHSPQELEKHCQEIIHQYFPISMEQLMQALTKGSAVYQEAFYPKLKEICQMKCLSLKHSRGWRHLTDQNIEDVCMETWICLYNKLKKNRSPEFTTPSGLCYYTKKITKYKALENYRQEGKESKNVEYTDCCIEPTSDDEIISSDFYQAIEKLEKEKNIELGQIKNIFSATEDGDVLTIMEAILYDDTPLAHALTQGINPTAVEVLRLVYKEKKQFNEIVELLFPETPKEEIETKSASIRKQNSRALGKLRKRLVYITSKKDIISKDHE